LVISINSSFGGKSLFPAPKKTTEMIFSTQTTTLQRLLPFVLVFAVYIVGMCLDVMDIDSAQYAEIAREMQATNEWLQVKQHGVDYLDKPPLLFWITAFVFKIFGVSVFTFRLVPVLLSFFGAYATYQLAKIYYSEKVAYLSALLLVSCQALFLMNHDLRTDNLLTTCIAFTLWQLAAYLQQANWKNLVGGFVGIGLAMLAKGPIGLVIPVLTFGVDVLIKRQWSAIFRWQYVVGLAIVALLLFPMSWGLYQQFDLHPEKVVNGQTGVSGLRFYYWTQSFGRITGENLWSNNPDPFFLVHTTFWSFLPWTVFMLIAYWKETVRIVRNRWAAVSPTQEVLVWWGITLTFLALSRSKYQLNHYIYPIYPLVAVLTAKYIVQLAEDTTTSTRQWLTRIQISVLGILSTVVGFLWYCFPLTLATAWVGLGLLGGFVAALYFVFRPTSSIQQLVTPYFCAIIGINLFLNGAIYPSLFNYQSESQAGHYVNANPTINKEHFYIVADVNTLLSLDFTVDKVVESYPSFDKLPQKGTVWVYCLADKYEVAQQQVPTAKLKVLQTFEDFHVSEVTLPFLLPSSRSSTVKKVYLLEVTQ